MFDNITKKKQLAIGGSLETTEGKLELLLRAKQMGYQGCIPDPIDTPFGDSCICSAVAWIWDKMYGGK